MLPWHIDSRRCVSGLPNSPDWASLFIAYRRWLGLRCTSAAYTRHANDVWHVQYNIWRRLRRGVGRGRDMHTSMLPLALLFTLASWAAGAGVFWLLLRGEAMGGAILRVVFIGLAALTVPQCHMTLVDGLLRQNRHVQSKKAT